LLGTTTESAAAASTRTKSVNPPDRSRPSRPTTAGPARWSARRPPSTTSATVSCATGRASRRARYCANSARSAAYAAGFGQTVKKPTARERHVRERCRYAPALRSPSGPERNVAYPTVSARAPAVAMRKPTGVIGPARVSTRSGMYSAPTPSNAPVTTASAWGSDSRRCPPAIGGSKASGAK
jgi:hypothetical protein